MNAGYTMTAHNAVELRSLVRPHIAIPVHYEGWSHFREGCAAIEAELALAPANVGSRVQFLPIGTATELAA